MKKYYIDDNGDYLCNQCRSYLCSQEIEDNICYSCIADNEYEEYCYEQYVENKELSEGV